MATHSVQYKLFDDARQRRMNEFTATDEPTALAAELAAARLMAEEAMNAGHHHLAASLFGTIAKLGSAHMATQLRIGELLEKAVVLRLGKQLVDLVCEAVRGRFEGWENVIDELADKVVNIVIETNNDEEPKLLDSAVWWPDSKQVEYRPTGRRHWLVNRRPVTKEGAAWEFRQVGMTHDTIRHLMRIHQLCYEIAQRLPPPPPDCMSVQEFGRLLVDELSRALSISVARRWAREHLRASRCEHPRKLDSWKRQFEQDKPKRSVTQDEFAQALKEAGFRVKGNDVYCEEVRA